MGSSESKWKSTVWTDFLSLLQLAYFSQLFLWVHPQKSDLIVKDYQIPMTSATTSDLPILYLVMKASPVDGPCIQLREGNLSEEFQLTHEIDCVNVPQITAAFWLTIGKTEGPMCFTAGIMTVAVICFPFRIENRRSDP